MIIAFIVNFQMKIYFVVSHKNKNKSLYCICCSVVYVRIFSRFFFNTLCYVPCMSRMVRRLCQVQMLYSFLMLELRFVLCFRLYLSCLQVWMYHKLCDYRPLASRHGYYPLTVGMCNHAISRRDMQGLNSRRPKTGPPDRHGQPVSDGQSAFQGGQSSDLRGGQYSIFIAPSELHAKLLCPHWVRGAGTEYQVDARIGPGGDARNVLNQN